MNTPVVQHEAKETQPSRRDRQAALAVWIERQIEDGNIKNYAEGASVLGVSRTRVTLVLRLLHMSGEAQESIAAAHFLRRKHFK